MTRLSFALAGLAAALALAACSSAPPVVETTPAFYKRLDAPGVALDLPSSLGMINQYRSNNRLAPLVPDAGLQAIAESIADRMASENKVLAEQELGLPTAFAARGLTVRSYATNLSAGYRTFAETFSGWREAKAQNAHMLAATERRVGLAIAYRPGSKYQVFWVMIVADAG
jgi:uncharacterized protein YkwD